MKMYESKSELATQAAKCKKPSKAVCLDLVEKLACNAYDDYELRGIVAQLYAHFIPTPAGKPKTVDAWIRKAINKGDVREYLQYVYVTENGNMVATDGHRLHVGYGAGEGMAPGFYDNAGNLVEIGQRFPNWERILPNPVNLRFCELDQIQTEVIETGQHDKFKFAYKLTFPCGTVIHAAKKYWDEMVLWFDGSAFVGINAKSPELCSISIKAGDEQAIVMPLRV